MSASAIDQHPVEHPVIMSGPMVRALIREATTPGSGKRQTRRLAYTSSSHRRLHAVTPDEGRTWVVPTFWHRVQPGHGLWVRETYSTDNAGTRIFAADPIWDGKHKGDYAWGWKAGRYMPRHASRLLLTVTEIRQQPLQDITEADAIAEGLTQEDGRWGVPGMPVTWDENPRQAYAALWDQLHDDPDWRANPQVFAVTFTVALQRPSCPAP